MKANIVKINLHGQIVDAIYDEKFDIESIESFKDNLRTMLNLSQAKEKLRKNIDSITDDELLPFLINDSKHKLTKLGEDIRRRGVFNPIILTTKLQLLDGNRRFFACKIMIDKLRKQKAPSKDIDKVKYVPAYIIQNNLSQDDKDRIIANLNFTEEFKERWPRQVRFSFIQQKYRELSKKGLTATEIFDLIQNNYGYTPGSVMHANKIMDFIHDFRTWRRNQKNKYFADEKRDDYNDRSDLIERDGFIYFEEFYNKTKKGRNAIANEDYYQQAKETFYLMVSYDEIESIYSVRDLIAVAGVPKCLKIISGGSYTNSSLQKAVQYYHHSAYNEKDEGNELTQLVAKIIELIGGLKPDTLKKTDLTLLRKLRNSVNSIIEE